MNEIKDFISDLGDATKKQATQAAKKIEEVAHQDPWILVAIFSALTAVLGGIIGFFFGRIWGRISESAESSKSKKK
jgi:ElaB/YqjD/DUF883 family membrane-anchored ribosome-binding protein